MIMAEAAYKQTMEKGTRGQMGAGVSHLLLGVGMVREKGSGHAHFVRQ